MTAQLAASKEGLSSMKLVSKMKEKHIRAYVTILLSPGCNNYGHVIFTVAREPSSHFRILETSCASSFN
jgi:hypothetical protein